MRELPAGFDVDVSSPASIARLASLAKDHLGGVDVWINNAGYSGSFQVRHTYLPGAQRVHLCSTRDCVDVLELLSALSFQHFHT